ncbi:rab-GTPase-TBC domain-containing protein [Radiomyces spectabilis]|uniref:rab-GTPase-TBC domain-containing protein n=1 Tax=Radiomyces spectabilis TaxID=64574 RepID=UPI002220403E|nr:rab-GTPase-TBC domain-containing protein [Radiomyces spectabilis]KAI8391521.1 rab-GTPase-TBC domain-containing protein [Radiomyces spectabilis]
MARRNKSKSHLRNKRGFRKTQHANDNDEFKRICKINEALRTRHLSLLRELAREKGGFVNDALRRRVWPVLLKCSETEVDLKEHTEKHRNEAQVDLDTPRSLNTFPQGVSEERRNQLQQELNRVIVRVLRSHPNLHYYQGFHDICAVFLLIFEPVIRELTMLDTLLKEEDAELYHHLNDASVLPYYCTSWVITWFSHDLNALDSITRLFDLFLSANPVMPLYVSAAVVLYRRNAVLEQPCEMSELHSFLSKIPQDLDIEEIIRLAVDLEIKYTPLMIQIESGIALDESSVINTYDRMWVKADTTTLGTAKQEADDILATPPTERKALVLPTKPSEHSSEALLTKLQHIHVQDTTLWTLLAVGAGMGTMALLLTNSDFMREWLTSI